MALFAPPPVQAQETGPLQREAVLTLEAAARQDEERLLCAFFEWLLPRSVGDRLATKPAEVGAGARSCRFDDFWRLFKVDGTMDWADFEQFVRWEGKFAGSARKLFDLLDDSSCGRLSARTVLQVRREFERSSDVKHSNLEDLKRVLIATHGSLGRAWRKCFDTECTGRCCHTVFVKTCRTAGFQGDLKSTWAELTNGDVHSQATLRDLDPQADELLVRFVQMLKQWHTTARDGWFAIMRANGAHGRLHRSEFHSVCTGFGFSEKESKKLLSCLDLNLDKWVSLDEWLFLSLWDLPGPLTSPRLAYGGPSLTARRPGAASVAAQSSAAAVPSSAASTTSASTGQFKQTRFSPPPRRTGQEERESLAEFVVVLTKEEYQEYQRRLRERQAGRQATSRGTARASSVPNAGRAESWSKLTKSNLGTSFVSVPAEA